MDEDSGSEIFEVERVIGLRRKGRGTQFYVRWKGYGSEEDSWEPRKNLSGCPDLVEEFVRLNPQHRSLLSGSENNETASKRKRGRDLEAAKSPQATPAQSPDAKRKRRTQSPQATLAHSPEAKRKRRTQAAKILEAGSSTPGAKPAPVKSSPHSAEATVTGERTAKPRRRDRSEKEPAAASASAAVQAPGKDAIPTSMPTPLQSPRPAMAGGNVASSCEPARQAAAATSSNSKTPRATPTSDVPVVSEADAQASHSCQSAVAPETTPAEVAKKEPAAPGRHPGDDTPTVTEARASPSTEETAGGLVIASSKGSSGENPAVSPTVENGKMTTTTATTAVEPLNSSACKDKESRSPLSAQDEASDEPMDTGDKGEAAAENSANAPAKVRSGNAGKDPSPAKDSVKQTTLITAAAGRVPAAKPVADRLKEATESVTFQTVAVRTDPIVSLPVRTAATAAGATAAAAAATPVKSACGMTPQSNKALGRTPGVADVFESTSATPLWKAPTSSGEQTCAYLTVDAVQQQGSMRQPHAPGHDPFTENWVKSLVGIELLGREETVNQQNIELQEQALEKAAAATTNGTNGTNSHSNGKLPSPKAPPVKVEQEQDDRDGSSSGGSHSSSEQELDLPFGTNLQSETHEENGDFDFDDYQESELTASEKNNCAASMDTTPGALSLAAMEGNVGVFRRAVLQKVDLNRVVDGKGASLLVTAIQYGQDEIVQVLLDAGCTTVNSRPHTGDTPLMIAAQRNRHAVCTRLVRAGAQLDAQSLLTKETALIMACKRDHMFTVEALLRPGADLSVCDSRGLTALEHVQAMSSTLEQRMRKHITRMTDFFMNAATQRVQSEGALELPPLLGFRSFSASTTTPYSIPFNFQKTTSTVNIRLFLMRGEVKRDSGGLRMTWARCGTVSTIHLNGEEAKPQVRHSMYQLWPRIGQNEIVIQLAPPPSSSDQQQPTRQMDRIFACLYNLKKHA